MRMKSVWGVVVAASLLHLLPGAAAGPRDPKDG